MNTFGLKLPMGALLGLCLAAPLLAQESLPQKVEQAIKAAQEEGASLRETTRVAKYSFARAGEDGALAALVQYRRLLAEGLDDHEAATAVMKVMRIRTRTRLEAGAGSEKGAKTRTRAETQASSPESSTEDADGDGEPDRLQIRGGEDADHDGEPDRLRTREGAQTGATIRKNEDGTIAQELDKDIEMKLDEKRRERERIRERRRVEKDETILEERRNRTRRETESETQAGDDLQKGR